MKYRVRITVSNVWLSELDQTEVSINKEIDAKSHTEAIKKVATSFNAQELK